jgi:hypothetical protein
MNYSIPLLAAALVSIASAAEAPRIFSGLLEKGVPVRGQVGMVLPPPEIDKYAAKIRAAKRADPQWFKDFALKVKPGQPLPYDPKLGLTKEEYTDYMKLWAKREFTPTGKDVMLVLRESFGGTWIISCTGSANCLSTIRYSEENDVFTSPNGELKRISDIKADADSLLGAWSGYEWKFEEESTLGRCKENLALGRFEGNKFGLIVYRFQEVSTEGRPVVEKDILVRFALGKAGHLKLPESQVPGQPAGTTGETTTPSTKSSTKSTPKR